MRSSAVLDSSPNAAAADGEIAGAVSRANQRRDHERESRRDAAIGAREAVFEARSRVAQLPVARWVERDEADLDALDADCEKRGGASLGKPLSGCGNDDRDAAAGEVRRDRFEILAAQRITARQGEPRSDVPARDLLRDVKALDSRQFAADGRPVAGVREAVRAGAAAGADDIPREGPRRGPVGRALRAGARWADPRRIGAERRCHGKGRPEDLRVARTSQRGESACPGRGGGFDDPAGVRYCPREPCHPPPKTIRETSAAIIQWDGRIYHDFA